MTEFERATIMPNKSLSSPSFCPVTAAPQNLLHKPCHVVKQKPQNNRETSIHYFYVLLSLTGDSRADALDCTHNRVVVRAESVSLIARPVPHP